MSLDALKLNHPWLVAAWPGMGNVALNAGVYLLAKLDMTLLAEFDGSEFFDIQQVEVKKGIIQSARHAQNRFFLWKDPRQQRDIVVLLGEAQPSTGTYSFCRQLLSRARQLGVERIITFAAMATPMHPQHPSRVFGAATDEKGLGELKRLELEIVEDGHIGGLNGVLLGAALEGGLSGCCLLGEMPHVLTRLPFPKASLGILNAFATMTGVNIDFVELLEQSETMDRQLGELLSQVEQAYGSQIPGGADVYRPEPVEEDRLNAADEKRIEGLFRQASSDRSKAFELKQELDRLGVFKEYEDRFLDLFKKGD